MLFFLDHFHLLGLPKESLPTIDSKLPHVARTQGLLYPSSTSPFWCLQSTLRLASAHISSFYYHTSIIFRITDIYGQSQGTLPVPSFVELDSKYYLRDLQIQFPFPTCYLISHLFTAPLWNCLESEPRVQTCAFKSLNSKPGVTSRLKTKHYSSSQNLTDEATATKEPNTHPIKMTLIHTAGNTTNVRI